MLKAEKLINFLKAKEEPEGESCIFKRFYLTRPRSLLFAILGFTMSANVATQEGDHGCYHYLLIYAISGSIFPIPTNSTRIQLVIVAILSLTYISRQYPTWGVEIFCNVS